MLEQKRKKVVDKWSKEKVLCVHVVKMEAVTGRRQEREVESRLERRVM